MLIFQLITRLYCSKQYSDGNYFYNLQYHYSHTPPQHATPDHTTSYHNTPRFTTPHHTTPHQTTLRHTTPHHTKPQHPTPKHTTPHPNTPRQTTPHHTYLDGLVLQTQSTERLLSLASIICTLEVHKAITKACSLGGGSCSGGCDGGGCTWW